MGKERKRGVNGMMKCGNERTNICGKMKTSFTSLMESSADKCHHLPPSRIVSADRKASLCPVGADPQEMQPSSCAHSYFGARWCLPH